MVAGSPRALAAGGYNGVMDGDPHERREDAVGRLKGAFADVPESRVLSEELIRERREEAERDLAEEEWPGAASANPAFAYLNEPEEDVHGPEADPTRTSQARRRSKMVAVEPNDRKRDANGEGADDPLPGELRAEVTEYLAEYLAKGSVGAGQRGKPRGLPKDRRPKIEGPDNAARAVIEGRG